MHISRRAIGPLAANCYILAAPGGDVVIDPGDDAAALIDFCEERAAAPKLILLTHGHFDHFAGALTLKRRYGARIGISKADAPALGDAALALARSVSMNAFEPFAPDELLEPGPSALPGLNFELLALPGHTPGGLGFYCASERFLISGDTLFADGCGRSDFPCGDVKQLSASLRRLLELPEDTVVYPGHGRSARIGEIKKGFGL